MSASPESQKQQSEATQNQAVCLVFANVHANYLFIF